MTVAFAVYLHPFTAIIRELPKNHWDRAIAFGAKEAISELIHVWVGAYLGFYQKLPLKENLLNIVGKANSSKSIKVTLGLPRDVYNKLNVEIPPFEQSSQLSIGR
jgi:hypothetical protein